jgi:uncharacterized protein YqiB (DUF1249 family)
MPKNTVYTRMFERLNDLIPGFQSISAGAVFSAQPRIEGEVTIFCHVTEAEGNMLLIELSGDRTNKTPELISPWLKVRVDITKRLAEVLEMEDAFSYQVVYVGAQAVNSRRDQINLFAMNWLQVMKRFDQVSRPVDDLLAA